MDSSCFQYTYSFLETGDSQYCDNELIIETGSDNHIGVLIGLRIAIAIYLYFAKCNLNLCFKTYFVSLC